jgi:hypothetical protein
MIAGVFCSLLRDRLAIIGKTWKATPPTLT